MKRRIACFLLSLIVFTSCCGMAFADNRETTVYITRTGKCYHTGSCSSLRQSKIEVTLEYAVSKGYSRCDKCHPPVPDFEVEATPMPRYSSGGGSSGPSSNYIYTPEPEEIFLYDTPKSEKTLNRILSICMLSTLILLIASLCFSSAFPDSHESLVETSWCIFIFLIIIDIILFFVRLIVKS